MCCGRPTGPGSAAFQRADCTVVLRKMLTEEIRSSLAARPCKAAVGQSLQAGSSVDLVSSPFKRWAFVVAHSIFGPIVKQSGAEDVYGGRKLLPWQDPNHTASDPTNHH